jgi:predicted phage terminase large subunit-like protein
VRTWEDADSPAYRQKAWDWFKGDVEPRLVPGSFVILIQTRWHKDDLAGRILEDAKRTGEKWEVVSLPAVAEGNDQLGREPGEYLWDDDIYGYGRFLRRQQKTQTPRNWSALYQQRPAPETGDYFKEEWLRPYVSAPDLKTLTIYGGSDFAVTSDGGDYTVHMVVGIDPDDKPWLLDLWRGQTASDKWIEAWCALSKQWKPNGWAFEQGQIKSGVGPFLEKRARETKTWTDMRNFPTRGDKAVRAQSMRGRMAMLGLHVPTLKPWYPALRAELLSFPAGKHDDQVDALGLVGQLLDIMGSGRKLKPEDLKFDLKRDGYRPPSAVIPLDSFKTM